MSAYSNPEPDEEPAISRVKAALGARGASGTLLWFAILTGIIIALTLVASRCGNDDDAGPDPTASNQSADDDQADADTTADTTETDADADADGAATDPDSAGADSDDDASDATGGGGDDDDGVAEADPTPVPEAPTAVASVDAFVDGGTATLAGLVADRATADGLVAAAESVLGQGAVVDELEIDPEARSEGATLTLSGSVEEQTAAQLAAALTGAYGDVAYDDAGAVILASVDVVADLNALFEANPVQFGLGSAEILDASVPILDNVAAALGEAPGLALEIQGHTDSTGAEDANQVLSQERASAVLTYLVGAGVNPERLTAFGFGSSIPVADNNTPEGQQANRRIEFAIVTG